MLLNQIFLGCVILRLRNTLFMQKIFLILNFPVSFTATRVWFGLFELLLLRFQVLAKTSLVKIEEIASDFCLVILIQHFFRNIGLLSFVTYLLENVEIDFSSELAWLIMFID